MKTNLPECEELLKIIMLKNDFIWDSTHSLTTINDWLNNFDGSVLGEMERERRLALWMLSNFVFYNQREVRHLCEDLFNRYVHYILSTNGLYRTGSVSNDLKNLINKTGFIPLGNPAESGAHILYYFRQTNELPKPFFAFELLRNESIKHIAVIDDVTLSGKQAVDYLRPLVESTNKEIFLLTFFSTQKAETSLRDALGINVISCLTLDERCRCFSDSSLMFNGFDVEREECKKMSYEYGLTLFPDHPIGYADGQHAFGFFYNTPDNTLPIFWANHNGWTPIFRRYDKKYGKEVNIFDINTFV